MGYDMRPASWDGQERPKITAKLLPCEMCCERPRAEVDTVGMWSATCRFGEYTGPDHLGCETWQELVSGWNGTRKTPVR